MANKNKLYDTTDIKSNRTEMLITNYDVRSNKIGLDI